MNKFEVRGMDLYYGSFHALKNININIPEKEITAFIGPSGCGKSTFLKSLNRMNDLVEGCRISGDIKLDGADIYKDKMDVNALRKRVGMVFQKPNPFPMSVYDNIAYGPRNMGLDEAEIQRRVKEAAAFVGLSDELLEKSPFELSGGMQQRVGIAAAMLLSPGVLLADEPTSALDVTLQKQVVEEMRMVRDTFGTAIVLVAHNLGVIGAMADNVLVLKDGKTVEYGKTGDVLTNPQADYTKALLAAVPRLRR